MKKKSSCHFCRLATPTNIRGGQFLPIGVGAQIYYAEGLEKLASNIEETRPTVMVVVPRLFEVLRQRMIKAVEKQGKFPNYLLNKALTIGERDYSGTQAAFRCADAVDFIADD